MDSTISIDPTRALALLAFFLPILAGGNLFLFLPATPALLVYATLAAGASWVLATAPRRREAPLGVGLAFALAALALLVIHASNLALRSAGPRAGITALALAIGTLIFYVLRRHPLRAAEARATIAALAAGTLVSAVYGQYQYWYAFPRIAPIMRANGLEPILSVNANFYSANTFAPFLASVSILLAALLFEISLPRARLAAGLALTAVVGTLTLTGSRATIGLLLVLGWPALRARTNHPLHAPKAAWLVGATVAAVGVATAWLSELVQVGLLGRLRIWQAALDMIADHWILGVGPGRFAEHFRDYQLDEYFTRYPHNIWLEVFAELGILGAAALTALLLLGGGAALHCLRRGGDRIHVAASSAILLLIAHALVDIDWQAPANSILLFLLVGIVVAGDAAGGDAEPAG